MSSKVFKVPALYDGKPVIVNVHTCGHTQSEEHLEVTTPERAIAHVLKLSKNHPHLKEDGTPVLNDDGTPKHYYHLDNEGDYHYLTGVCEDVRKVVVTNINDNPSPIQY